MGNKPECIIIHHSLTKDSGTVSWGAIKKYHMEKLNFTNVGYHYGIELVGGEYKIFKGRAENEIAAHTKGMNDKSLGICLVGNFDWQEPCEAQLAKLYELLEDIFKRHGKLPIYPHNHFASYKSCPGKKFDMGKVLSYMYGSKADKTEIEFIKSIKKLAEKNVIDSPDYWINNKKFKREYVMLLINKIVKKLL